MIKCPTKLCRVCGDKAIAFYFNGLACESCKVFFRRNAPNREKIKCRANKLCKIDFYMRKCCAACRLEKCFSIGMQWKDRNYSVNLTEKNENLRKILETDQKPSQQEALQLEIIKNPNSRMQLDAYEWSHIEEVQTAMAIFENESVLQVIGEAGTIVDAFNLFSNYARRIVKFCKNMSAFKQLKRDDQFCILKPFYFEICAIRYAFYYDAQMDVVPIIANETGSQVLHYTFKKYFENTNIGNIGMVIKGFVQGLNAQMENDSIVQDLLIVQFLFKQRDDVTCPEFLRYRYCVYCRVLMRYLEVKYQNRAQAAQKYDSLMAFLNENMSEFKDNLIQLLNRFDTSQVAQVLTEIFS